MSLIEIIEKTKDIGDTVAVPLLLLAIVLAGTHIMAGKQYKETSKGRTLNTTTMMTLVTLVVTLGFVSLWDRALIGVSYWNVNILNLLVLPVTAGSLYYVNRTVNTEKIPGYHAAKKVMTLVLMSAGVLWFLKQFRGWGIIFFGSLMQLLVLVVVVFILFKAVKNSKGPEPK